MIGVGVYVGSYYSLLSLMDARLVLIVWLVGGLHALCGAIAYGAVAKRLPVSGGEYSYLSRCVHPAIGFVAGWISIIAGFTAPIAASALLLGKYLMNTVQAGSNSSDSNTQVRIVATAAILVAASLHAFHIKVGTTFNNFVIAVKFVCFAIFLVVGIPVVLQGTYTGILVDPLNDVGTTISIGARLQQPETIMAMIVSLFYCSLAYTGFNASIYLAGEIGADESRANQRDNVSRSMWMACILVMIVYLLLNYVFLYGLSPELIIQSGEGFVAAVAENIGGKWLSGVIQFAIILSAATSILAMMATGPMVYAQMAADGRLPRFFKMTNHVPRSAIVAQSLLTCAVVWITDIKDIIGYLGLTLTACGVHLGALDVPALPLRPVDGPRLASVHPAGLGQHPRDRHRGRFHEPMKDLHRCPPCYGSKVTGSVSFPGTTASRRMCMCRADDARRSSGWGRSGSSRTAAFGPTT